MKLWYYQIKGKEDSQGSSWSKWSFPPIFSGKVDANNKQEAKKIIEEDYGKKFPLRVLQKDMDKNEFLLRIQEFNDSHKRLFEINQCVKCKRKFRIIDHYNDSNQRYNSENHCCDKCYNEDKDEQRLENYNEYGDFNSSIPVIYKITNKNTNQCYIGQTIRSFTLRWWEHIKWGSNDCKFQKALKKFKITDWTFEVIEIIASKDKINEREFYYIKKFNSIDNGYNTMKVIGEDSSSNDNTEKEEKR